MSRFSAAVSRDWAWEACDCTRDTSVSRVARRVCWGLGWGLDRVGMGMNCVCVCVCVCVCTSIGG